MKTLRRPLALLMLTIVLIAAVAAWVWADNSANRGISFTTTPEALPVRPALGVNLFDLHPQPDPPAGTGETPRSASRCPPQRRATACGSNRAAAARPTAS